jgi:stage V sporulation protein G
MPVLEPYWGKPAVRNLRGEDGNVGIIRSPLRAILLPDQFGPLYPFSASGKMAGCGFAGGRPPMEITDIRIKKVESDNKLKAYVTITFDNCFVVHNLKIIMGQFGRFVAMPSRKTRDGEFKDIAHPINSDFRRKIQARILEEFDKGGGEQHISGQDVDAPLADGASEDGDPLESGEPEPV